MASVFGEGGQSFASDSFRTQRGEDSAVYQLKEKPQPFNFRKQPIKYIQQKILCCTLNK